jgi:N-sulfoglucosamine sulfohydrolase
MKKTVLWLLVVVAISGWAVLLKSPEADKPNILYIVADDAGLDMSAYGRTWVSTPAFDRVAKEGILFQNAYTPNAKCAPSRACMLTGRNPWQLDAAMNHVIYFPNYFKTYPEALAENGYFVGYTGKGYAPGKALNEDGSKRELLIKNYSTFKTTPPAKAMSDNDYAANFADFVQKADGKPWCFWLGFTEPHRAYEYGAGIRKGGKKPEMIEHVPGYFSDSLTTRTDLLDYAYEIEYLDSHVEKVLKLLEEAGQLENTLIVFTSDHGMPFPRTKGNAYENANHVPFAVMWKRGIKNPGRTVNDYVNMTDLAPTFLDVAGIEPVQSGMRPMIGRSLVRIFNATKGGQVEPGRNFQLVGQERHDYGRPHDVGYPIRGLHKNGLLYIKNYQNDRWPACNPETGYLNCDGSPTKTLILNNRRRGVDTSFWQLSFGKRPAEELYDLKKDPDCLRNLAGVSGYQSVKKAMEKEMEAKLLAQGDLRMQGYGHLYEQYPLSENVNGFYERFMQGEKFNTGWVNPGDFEKEPIDD